MGVGSTFLSLLQDECAALGAGWGGVGGGSILTEPI